MMATVSFVLGAEGIIKDLETIERLNMAPHLFDGLQRLSRTVLVDYVNRSFGSGRHGIT